MDNFLKPSRLIMREVESRRVEKVKSTRLQSLRKEVEANGAELDRLTRLPGEENFEKRMNAMTNPKCPKATLHRIARGKNELYRRFVAGNPNTPPVDLKYLVDKSTPKYSEGLNKDILLNVAANPSAPPETLAKLFQEVAMLRDDLLVKYVLVGNPNTPAKILTALYGTAGFGDVQLLDILENPNTPKEIKDKIRIKLDHSE